MNASGGATFRRLFSPLRVGGLTLANRLVHVATLGNLAEGNRASQRQADYYEARARGGVGLIVTEGMPVHAKSVPTPFTVPLFDPAVVPGLRRLTDAAHRHGVPIVAQLWHVGRQQLWTPISAPWAPSAEADPHSLTIPHAMTAAEIREVVDAFALSAAHAREAGFDGVELHGAHGYLITQFLSPWSNRRGDEYGGSFDNRLRFLAELIAAIRAGVGRALVLGVKLNGDELVPGGIDAELAGRIAARLAEGGQIDYLGISQGNFSKSLEAHAPDMHFGPAPFRALAGGIRKASGGLPVYAMAGFTTAAEAEDALAAGDADLVGMSRALIADPDLPRKAREGRVAEVRPCIQCNVCWGAIPLGKPVFCLYNPGTGREAMLDADAPPRAESRRRVVVVGGGLAGLEAARVAALRGHEVILLERGRALGGQALLAERLPGRARFGDMTRWLLDRVSALPIDVRLQTAATVEGVLALRPDAVVLASGSRPPSGLPGAGPVRVINTWDVLDGADDLGARVALVDADGDHEGAGVAELLAAQGRLAAYVTPFETVAFSMNYLSRIGVMRRLGAHDVPTFTATAARRVDAAGLVVEHLYARRERTLPVDTVVLAGPNRAEDDLAERLRARVAALHVIGDAYAPRKAAAAIHEGHRAALSC